MKNSIVIIIAVLLLGLLGSKERRVSHETVQPDAKQFVDPDAKNIGQLYKIDEEKDVPQDKLLASAFSFEFGGITVEDISRINSDYFLNRA